MFGIQAPRSQPVQVQKAKPASKPTETRSAAVRPNRPAQAELRRGKKGVKSAPLKKPIAANPKADVKRLHSKVEDDPYMPEYIQEIDKPQYDLRVINLNAFYF